LKDFVYNFVVPLPTIGAWIETECIGVAK